MVEEYKPYYLKLKPKEPIEFIGGAIFKLENSRLPFGFFSRHILNHGKPEWVVLRFDPYSRDVGLKGSSYKNREDSLKEAIEYVEGKNFTVTPIDLESLIDKI